MARRARTTSLPPPFLKRVWLPDEALAAQDQRTYPFSLPIVLGGGFDLRFERPITILVGENGSGKSTLLEAIATMAGFGEAGVRRAWQQSHSRPLRARTLAG